MAEQLIRWVTPIPPDFKQVKKLRELLDTIGKDPGGNALMPFAGLPMLHFASLTLFDEQEHTNAPILVFESNIDGSCRDYVNALLDAGRQGLDAIYSGCEDYPGPAASGHTVARYLMGLKRKANLYHNGHPNRSVRAIKGDFELRRSIARELETHPNLIQLAPADIIRAIRCRARCPRVRWRSVRPWHSSWEHRQVLPPAPLDEIEWVPDPRSWLRVRFVLLFGFLAWLVWTAFVIAIHYVGLSRTWPMMIGTAATLGLVAKSSTDAKILRGAVVAGLLATLVEIPFRLVPLFTAPPAGLVILALVILAPLGFLLVRSLNVLSTLPLTQPFVTPDQTAKARAARLVEAEDRPRDGQYNHVAGLSVLTEQRRGLRWLRTWLSMFVLNLFYRTMFVHGKLVTIPSIHFAQWSLVDDRHVLFVTNYDGGADSYLDDFFNSLASGVAFIWIDTKIFPGTLDPRHLKSWVRKGQTLARARYRAAVYDGLTVGAINSNTCIRNRLLRGSSDASARRWLRRFATVPEEPSLLARLSHWLRARAGATS
jgi:hypothetical protein